MPARDIMTANPRVVTPDASIGRAAALMRDLHVGAIPVVLDNESLRPVGIITDRDIAVRHAALDHGRACAVWEHMTSGPLDLVPPDAELDEVERRLRVARSRRLLVVDRDRRLLGVVTRSDLVREGSEGRPEPSGGGPRPFRGRELPAAGDLLPVSWRR